MSEFDAYRVLSFDCYGTLIDWETGIAASLRPWADRFAPDISDEELITRFGSIETGVERERPSDPYPEILAEVHRRLGSELGAPVDEDEAYAFGASVGDWPAFADSGDALARLSERYRLVILSNVDRASFARSNRRLGVEFDQVLTAEELGSYKPDQANFRALIATVDSMGLDRSRLLHVAESLYHDHEPAGELGIDSVWIHRRHGRKGFGATHPPAGPVQPRWRFTSMADFADAALA
ncbi:MAG: haloacid dehalogenase type II [Acidimicrobiia bacterium]|jgi:2-haloacid dehalogenase